MTPLYRRTILAGAIAAPLAAPAFIRSANAAGTVKLGCLFSSSGTMANLEGRLNYVVRMAADEINARGGVTGSTIEVVVSDPASDWPLYAQTARQMLQEEKVAALFGCWTSVSRKTVLPVVEPWLAAFRAMRQFGWDQDCPTRWKRRIHLRQFHHRRDTSVDCRSPPCGAICFYLALFVASRIFASSAEAFSSASATGRPLAMPGRRWPAVVR